MLSLNGRMTRWIAVGLAGVIALLAWTSASAQPQPPFQVYGTGEAGDTIGVYHPTGMLKGEAQVGPDGTWYLQIECLPEVVHELGFTINDHPATAEVTMRGSSLAEIALTPLPEDYEDLLETAEDAMTEDGGMMSEDDDMISEDGGMMSGDDDMMSEDGMMEDEEMLLDSDSMSEDGDMMSEDGMMEDEEMSEDQSGYPDTGSGGLSDGRSDGEPSTSALVGTLLVLAAVVGGAGVWKLRRRRA